MTKSEKRKKLMADLSALEDEKEELDEAEEELEEEEKEAEEVGDEKAAKEARREKKMVAADAASVQALIELLREDLKSRGKTDKEIAAAEKRGRRRF